uniref:Uncharacterized protein n=1 Tax=Anguilla anguilla TaxID=7936 RepID=A0A0E9W1Z6_ANGAN
MLLLILLGILWQLK